jgi:hypothetical protein
MRHAILQCAQADIDILERFPSLGLEGEKILYFAPQGP